MGMQTVGGTRAPRNPRIEALRLVAIVAIAVFHTFLPWFNALAYGVSTGVDPAPLRASAPALLVVGFASLLGTMGNHVFYMISGFFLLPSMSRAAVSSGRGAASEAAPGQDGRRFRADGPAPAVAVPGYWLTQYRRVGRKALTVLVSVLVYIVIVLLIDLVARRAAPTATLSAVSLHSLAWLFGGLEFIWVYLLLLALAPVFGWIGAHWRGWPTLLPVLFFLVMALNVYIAFFAQGTTDRGLLDWRKLMSAVTYLIGFLMAGLIAQFRAQFARLGPSLLVCSVLMSLVVVSLLALAHDTSSLGAVSFKSTSLLSFLMASGALIAAVRCEGGRDDSGPRPQPAVTGVKERTGYSGRASAGRSGGGWLLGSVTWLAAGILGFYIVQALFFPLWSRLVDGLLGQVLALSGPGGRVPGWGVVLFALVGGLVSVLFVLVVLCVDRLVRRPLLRVLGLG